MKVSQKGCSEQVLTQGVHPTHCERDIAGDWVCPRVPVGGDADEQRAALLALGVAADRVYLDVGLTRPRPALREALAVARGGDTLVVTALSRLARSVPDAYELLNGLAAGEVTLAIGEDHYPPSLPVTHVLVELLALTAQLQTGLDSRRTRVGLAAARTRGQLRGRPPKLNHRQERHIVGLYWTGRYTVREIGELFNVSPLNRLPRRPASRPHR